MYILLLKEIEGTGTLPIWIGKPEADSIALALGGVMTPRPLTHDLVKNILAGLKTKVTRIVITEILDKESGLRPGTWYVGQCGRQFARQIEAELAEQQESP